MRILILATAPFLLSLSLLSLPSCIHSFPTPSTTVLTNPTTHVHPASNPISVPIAAKAFLQRAVFTTRRRCSSASSGGRPSGGGSRPSGGRPSRPALAAAGAAAHGQEFEDEDDDDDSCFPASAIVHTPNGPVNMSQLSTGTVISTSSGPSLIHSFTHRVTTGTFRFIRLRTSHAHTLTLSHGHYLPVSGQLQTADSVRVGDTLHMNNGQLVTVQNVDEVTDVGLYNPHSLSGSLVVNGYDVSCYTRSVHPPVAHGLLLPVRAMFRALSLDMLGSAMDAGASSLPLPVAWRRTFVTSMSFGARS